MEMLPTSEAYLEPCQTGLKFLSIPILENTVFSFIIDIWQGSEFASDHDTVTFVVKIPFKKFFFLRTAIKRKV